jgi:hypothetical protein
MIDAGDAGPARQRHLHDDPAKRAKRTGHDNDISVHDDPPSVRGAPTITKANWTCNDGSFKAE